MPLELNKKNFPTVEETAEIFIAKLAARAIIFVVIIINSLVEKELA